MLYDAAKKESLKWVKIKFYILVFLGLILDIHDDLRFFNSDIFSLGMDQ